MIRTISILFVTCNRISGNAVAGFIQQLSKAYENFEESARLFLMVCLELLELLEL